MKTVIPLILLCAITPIRAADQWNNPARERLEKIARTIVIPRIDYERATGVDVLEFIRSRVWSIHPIDGDGTRPAHEYRCSPDRLLKSITLKRQNISYGDALNEACRQLGLSWRIDRGKIIFSDAPHQEKAKSKQVEPRNPR